MFIKWWRLEQAGRRQVGTSMCLMQHRAASSSITRAPCYTHCCLNQRMTMLQVWRLYGQFTCLMWCGSCLGAFAWTARCQKNWYHYTVILAHTSEVPSYTSAEIEAMQLQSDWWKAAFLILYALELLCLTSCKLLVLDRMISSYLGSVGAGSRERKWVETAHKTLHAVVLAGNVTGLVANVVAVVYIVYRDNYSDHIANSVQLFCEFIVLLLIIVAFAVLGFLCTRVLKAAPLQGARVQRQISMTVASVFVTFILRAIYACIFAVSDALQNDNAACQGKCDSPCFNNYTLILTWLDFTPEFQGVVVLISSPLTMLVALWGMSNARMLQLMASQAHHSPEAVSLACATAQGAAKA